MKQAGNKAGADSLDGIVAGLTMQPSLRARGQSCFRAGPERTRAHCKTKATVFSAASAERAHQSYFAGGGGGLGQKAEFPRRSVAHANRGISAVASALAGSFSLAPRTSLACFCGRSTAGPSD